MIDNKSFPVASLNPERQTIIKKKNLISFLLFEQSHNFVFYLFLSFYFLFSIYFRVLHLLILQNDFISLFVTLL